MTPNYLTPQCTPESCTSLGSITHDVLICIASPSLLPHAKHTHTHNPSSPHSYKAPDNPERVSTHYSLNPLGPEYIGSTPQTSQNTHNPSNTLSDHLHRYRNKYTCTKKYTPSPAVHMDTGICELPRSSNAYIRLLNTLNSHMPQLNLYYVHKTGPWKLTTNTLSLPGAAHHPAQTAHTSWAHICMRSSSFVGANSHPEGLPRHIRQAACSHRVWTLDQT